MFSKGSEKRRICNRKELPVHWWFGSSHRYQDGLAGRDSGLDYHVLSQFQFDGATPRHWFSDAKLEDWYGIQIDRNGKIISIDLTDKNVISLPDSIGKLSDLLCLMVGRNLIDKLPDSIMQLSKLRVLQIHGNRSMELPDSIASMPNLRILHDATHLAGDSRFLLHLPTPFDDITEYIPEEVLRYVQNEEIWNSFFDMDHNNMVVMAVALHNALSRIDPPLIDIASFDGIFSTMRTMQCQCDDTILSAMDYYESNFPDFDDDYSSINTESEYSGSEEEEEHQDRLQCKRLFNSQIEIVKDLLMKQLHRLQHVFALRKIALYLMQLELYECHDTSKTSQIIRIFDFLEAYILSNRVNCECLEWPMDRILRFVLYAIRTMVASLQEMHRMDDEYLKPDCVSNDIWNSWQELLWFA